MVSAQLLEKDRAKIPQKVPFFFIYRGILLYNLRIVHWCLLGSNHRNQSKNFSHSRAAEVVLYFVVVVLVLVGGSGVASVC